VANPVLGKLQGQGLVETTTAGIEQAGGQLATTPVGAAMQGRGPSSIKMAGTAPAKVNALATARGLSPTNMRDVTSAALGQLREAGRIMEGQEAAVAETAKRASVLGRVDDQIAKLAEQKTLAKLQALKFGGAQLDQTKLPGYDNTKLETLRTSIGDLISGGTALTDSDIATINEALTVAGAKPLELTPEKLPSIPILAKSLSTLFTKTSDEELQSNISKAILDAKTESTIGSLDDQAINAIFATPDKSETQTDLLNLLASITGLDATKDADLAKLRGMQLSEVRSAIDGWKQTEFKNVGELRKTLNDPTASRAQRQLALQELRKQGQIGVTGAELKVNDLEKQMQEGDIVRIGTEEFTVEELFTDPAKLLQLQTWIDNPDTAPPELKTWLENNQNAIGLKVSELMGAGETGLSGALERVKANAAAVKLDDSAASTLPKETLEQFFPEFANVGLDTKIPADSLAVAAMPETTPAEKAAKQKAQAELDNYNKYKLLQNPATARNAALLLTNLGTIAGVDGKKIFAELTPAQMAQLAQSENAVNDFRAALQDRNNAANFSGATNFSAEFKDLARYLDIDSTAGQFANLAGKDLSAYADIFKAAGLGNLLSNGKLNQQFFADKIGELKKYSLSDLIAGKNRNIKQELTRLSTTLQRTLERVPTEDMPGSMKERDQLFRQKNPGLAPAQEQIDALLPEENKLGGENHENWLDYEKKRKAYPTEAQFFRNTPPEYRDSAVYFDTFRDQIMAHSAAEKKWKDSERRFWDVKNRRLDIENRAAQIDKEYRDKFQSWFDTEQGEMQKRNKAVRERYAKLADLFGGIG
jgi:hypothetical protein